MYRVKKRKCDLLAVMRKFKINQRMLAELLLVNKASIYQWIKKGKIPVKHLTALRAITRKKAKEKQRWMPYDICALREELNANKTDIANLLNIRGRNISYWEKKAQIPRALLPRIRALEREAKE